MNDDPPGALQGLECSGYEMLPGLNERLHGDVVRNQVVVDEVPEKFKLCFTGRGKSDFNLLETDGNQQFEHFQLLLDIHGNGQRLIAVAQIDAAPNGRLGDGLAGPLPVR